MNIFSIRRQDAGSLTQGLKMFIAQLKTMCGVLIAGILIVTMLTVMALVVALSVLSRTGFAFGRRIFAYVESLRGKNE